MIKIFKPIVVVSLLLIITATITSCKKNKMAKKTDKELLDMAKVSSGFVWFKNSAELLDKSAGTGHSQPFLRTRYNAIAATVLDSANRIKTGISFPEGSLIVKEL